MPVDFVNERPPISPSVSEELSREQSGCCCAVVEPDPEVYSPRAVSLVRTRAHWGTLENPDGRARITGPCGDTMEFHVQVKEGTVAAVRYTTNGCVGSRAAGAMAAKMALGRGVEQARAILPEEVLDALAGLPPDSEHCARLAANTLRAALDHYVRETLRDWKSLYRRR